MNLAQVTCNYFNTKTLNKFYCNTEYVSYGNFSHLNLSKINLPSSAKIIAFGLPQFDFIPTKIKNSIREAVVISTIDDSNIFADSTNNWIKKHKDKNHHSLFYKKNF